MRLDPAFISVVVDLLINLSAGWIGAAVIIPVNARPAGKIRFVMLTINLFFATVLLFVAYFLKKQI